MVICHYPCNVSKYRLHVNTSCKLDQSTQTQLQTGLGSSMHALLYRLLLFVTHIYGNKACHHQLYRMANTFHIISLEKIYWSSKTLSLLYTNST